MLGAILSAARGALECAVVEWDVSEATAAALPDLQALRDALACATPRVRSLDFDGRVRAV